jgi:hypothetical protein
MEIPGLGTVTKDDRFGWHYSEPISVQVLGGKMCRIVVEGYEEDDAKHDYHAAITNFLSIDPSVLKEAEPFHRLGYQACR